VEEFEKEEWQVSKENRKKLMADTQKAVTT